MKLKRTWPAICIWVIFVIFNIVMVASYSFFSGLFPETNRLVYSVILTVLGILVTSVAVIGLGRICGQIDLRPIEDAPFFKIMYSVLLLIVIAGGIFYRTGILSRIAGDITGKYSLYENAMVGGTPAQEYDLLSIVYTGLLRPVLFFTGNIISVPFYYQIACFTLFIILGTITVRMLLGKAAAFVFAAYVSFMPVFTPAFTGLDLSTDSLFTAMFGIELFIVALFLRGIVQKKYDSAIWVVWYVIVGIIIAFMTYVDAGTVIMILPFFIASLVICGSSVRAGVIRLLYVIASGIVTFLALLSQEAGISWLWERVNHWFLYFFNNTNTFSTFWTYTEYKIIYLITVIAMSGVIVGFWRNRNFERISPWLFSMLLMFATVPFMGPTRMNTQTFVTIYYAFILACVASLIVMRPDETAEDELSVEGYMEEDEASEDEASEDVIEEDEEAEEEPEKEEEPETEESEQTAVESEEVKEESEEDKEPESEGSEEEKEPESEGTEEDKETETEEPVESKETESEEPEEEKEPESEEAVEENGDESQKVETEEQSQEPEQEKEKLEYVSEQYKGDYSVFAAQGNVFVEEDEQRPAPVPEIDEYLVSYDARPQGTHDLEEAIRQLDELSKLPEMVVKPKKQRARFVPVGMVLPEDDEDMDQTPHMKMPELKSRIGADGKVEKLKVGVTPNKRPAPSAHGFDIPLNPGDDFDI